MRDKSIISLQSFIIRWSIAFLLLFVWALPALARNDGQLIVADPAAEKLYVYELPSLTLQAEFDNIHMVPQAGFLPLKGERIIFINEEAAPPDEHEGEDEHGHADTHSEASPSGEMIMLKMNLRGEPAIIGRAVVNWTGGVGQIAVHPKMEFAAVASGAVHAEDGDHDEDEHGHEDDHDEEHGHEDDHGTGGGSVSVVDLRWWTSSSYSTIATNPIESEAPGIAIARSPDMLLQRLGSADDHEDEHAPGDRQPIGRLLIGDADTGALSVIDLGHGDVEQDAFDMGSRAGRIYATKNGRFAIAVATDANNVHVFDGGIYMEEHGDHFDLINNPVQRLDLDLSGDRPVHLYVGGEWATIFYDGSGDVVLLNEREMEEEGADYSPPVFNVGPHHGAAVPLYDGLIATTTQHPDYDSSPADYRLPVGADIRDIAGNVLYSAAGCDGLHGDAGNGHVAVFGCIGGALAIEAHDGQYEHVFIPPPAGEPDDFRLTSVWGYAGLDHFFALGSAVGLYVVEPEEESMAQLIPASEELRPISVAISHDGQALLVLMSDGELRMYDAKDLDLLASTTGFLATPVETGFWGRPHIATAPGAVFVTDSVGDKVLQLDPHNLDLVQHWDVAGNPAKIAFVGIKGEPETHDEHDHEGEDDHEGEHEDGHDEEHHEEGIHEAFRLSRLIRNEEAFLSDVELGSRPQGDVISHKLKVYCSATDMGIECSDIDGGDLTPGITLPYDTAERSGGRALYVRLADDQRTVFSFIRDDSADPTDWTQWSNDAYIGNIETGAVTRVALGPGLLHRFALSKTVALYILQGPQGDRAFLLDADPQSPTFTQIMTTIALPALQEPLDPDLPPLAEGQQLRLPALTPDGQWGFVTHGGDGLISVINTAQAEVVQQLGVPTPLAGGGYLTAVQKKMKLSDTIGR